MTSPAWLMIGLAVVTLSTAAYCAGRLVYAQALRQPTDLAVDAFHVAMGIAVAGMLVPSLAAVPNRAGLLAFGAATAWFAATLIRGRRAHRGSASAAHAGHVLGGAAMAYMYWSMHAAATSGMPMPGMTHPGAEQLPAVGVVLAFGLLGYAWWTTLRVAGLTRVALVAGHGHRIVAPRLAACCEVAMSVAMAVPLIALA
jgi:uncharacterized protein DUF5134